MATPALAPIDEAPEDELPPDAPADAVFQLWADRLRGLRPPRKRKRPRP